MTPSPCTRLLIEQQHHKWLACYKLSRFTHWQDAIAGFRLCILPSSLPSFECGLLALTLQPANQQVICQRFQQEPMNQSDVHRSGTIPQEKACDPQGFSSSRSSPINRLTTAMHSHLTAMARPKCTACVHSTCTSVIDSTNPIYTIFSCGISVSLPI